MRQALAFLALGMLVCAAAAQTYPPVVPGTRLEFPADHGAHPAYRTEWWYVTGWLDSAAGSPPLGFQVTFFRVRTGIDEDNPSRFAPRQIVFAHAALSDPSTGRLRHAQRSARTGFGHAGAEEGSTRVWIGDWSLRLDEAGAYRARLSSGEFELDLELRPTQPILLQGEDGFSRKDADPRHASYYYSRPHLRVQGTVVRDGRRQVVGGSAWLDHEWSSELMPEAAVGWDWVGLNLDDGGALMAFRMRDASGRALWASATLRSADGAVRRFAPGDVGFAATRRWRSPRTATDYPVAIRLTLGTRSLDLDPLIDDQEMDARSSTGTLYWEGAVRASEAGREIGRGYLELTGYGSRLRL